jgi:hypothetical protein
MPHNKSCPKELASVCSVTPKCPMAIGNEFNVDIEILASEAVEKGIKNADDFLPYFRFRKGEIEREYGFDESPEALEKALKTCACFRQRFMERLRVWENGIGELHPIGPDIIGTK